MRFVLFAASVLVITAAFYPSVNSLPAMAQDTEGYHYEFIYVDINILANSDMEVTETQKLAYTSGDFHSGYRWIYTHEVDSIDVIEVWENGQKYPENPTGKDRIERQKEGSSLGSDTYAFTTWTDENKLWIGWWFPETTNGSRTFTVRYVVHGGLRIHDDGDQLRWEVISKLRDVSVHLGVCTIHFPQSVSQQELKINTHIGTPGVGTYINMTDDRTLIISTDPIPERGGLTIKAIFPHGIVASEKPSWQIEMERWSDRRLVLGIAGATFAVLFGSAAAYKTRLKKYRLIHMIGGFIWER